MTKVFVHGNPETEAIWDDLLGELARRGITDTVTLVPPGFGAPVPAGFGATQAEYRDWLLAELRAVPGEIDLVGHDWGAGHVYGALAAEPGIVRSWAADCAGLLHPNYVWHDAAQGWQTAGAGEEMVAGMVALDDDTFATVFGGLGMGDTIARKVKKWVNGEMAASILSLYRSGAQPAMAALGSAFRSAAPANGLVLIAENDHYAGDHGMHAEVAAWVGAGTARLAGVGHWWMVEDPRSAADVLTAHWAR
ncbi:MAG: hypothetical protein RI912_1075 [Actinomycetota bacterium]